MVLENTFIFYVLTFLVSIFDQYLKHLISKLNSRCTVDVVLTTVLQR